MLLRDVWPESTDRKFIVAIASGRVKHYAVATVDEAEKRAAKLDAAGAEVYFAPALFTGKRRQEDVAGIGAFWLDLDCGEGKPYPDPEAALAALLGWCQTQRFPRPSHIVSSGRGLHVYWGLDAAYPLEAWRPVAQRLKQALRLAGVHADPARTADAASLLRVPGTTNRKGGESLPVQELHRTEERLSLEQFAAALPAVGPQRVGPSPSGQWSVDNYPAGDAGAIAAQCAQMRLVRDKAGAVAEPLWRAALSVLWRCEGAETLIHDWSRGDPRYDPEQARAKAAATGGPATCAHFSEVSPEGCVGCPLAGKVTSPIQITLPPTSVPLMAGARPSSIGRFRVAEAGIWWTPPAEADNPEPVRVCEVPIWVVEVRERARQLHETADSGLVVEWTDFAGQDHQALLPQATLHDRNRFVEWLARCNIISAVREVKLLVAYIGQFTLNILKQRGARRYYSALGWYDAGFLVGDTLVTAKGTQQALVQGGGLGKLKITGSPEKWAEGIQVLNAPEYYAHAFAVLCGFGSALLPLVDVQSAVVSLAGCGGAGKSLAARAAVSIYADPEVLMQSASATVNAVEVQLETCRHVPYLMDEVTNMPVHRLAQLVYTMANGTGKSSLTRTREQRETGSWRLVPFITSNHPLLEFHMRDMEEAHRLRILELHFATPMPASDAARVYDAIAANHGAAAVPYLQAVAKIRGKIPALFHEAMDKILTLGDLPSQGRFGIWTLTAALLGGQIARTCKLISFDPWAVVQAAAGKFQSNLGEIKPEAERAGAATLEWLTAESKRICHWKMGRRDMGEAIDNPVARDLGDGLIAVHKREFLEMLMRERISLAAIGHWLRMVTHDEKRWRLAPGCPAVLAVLFDKEKLGWDEGDHHDPAL